MVEDRVRLLNVEVYRVIMNKLEKFGEEKISYEGKIFEVISQQMKSGDKIINFELARRSPGIRLIVIKENQILLTKEYRVELGEFDYRLPGGKVFDSLSDFKEAKKKNKDMIKLAKIAAKKECLEEVGLKVKNIKHFKTSRAGATVEWDLYYFIVDKFEESEDGQNLEIGEIIHPEWKTIEEIKKLILENKIKEDRTVGVLSRYIL